MNLLFGGIHDQSAELYTRGAGHPGITKKRNFKKNQGDGVKLGRGHER